MGCLTDTDDLRDPRAAAPREGSVADGSRPSPRSAEILQVLNRILDAELAVSLDDA